MRDIEVLKGLRAMETEFRMLAQQMDFLMSDGAPRGYTGSAAGGGGRGTNHQEAARQQHIDYMAEMLKEREAELCRMRARFEEILTGVLDTRVRVILRCYYALGMTDEKIGEEMGLSTRRVNAMRNECLRMLEKRKAA